MMLRATSHGDERRRRVLIDENTRPEEPASPRSAEKSKEAPAYSDSARLENQPRVTDFVPTKLWKLALVILFGLFCIGGLEALYWFGPATETATEPWGLRGPGSLASWFSALVMLHASAVSLLIYSLRRHRTDDYHARYRIWPWAAAVLFVTATGQVTVTLEALRQILAGEAWAATITLPIWWSVVTTLPLAVLAIWVLVDLWRSRSSFVMTSISLALWSVGWILELSQVQFRLDPRIQYMVANGFTLVGQYFLLISLLWHAKGIILTANSEVAAPISRAKRPKAKPVAKSADTSETKGKVITTSPTKIVETNGRKLRVDQPSAVPEPKMTTVSPRMASATSAAQMSDAASTRNSSGQSAAESEDADGNDHRRLSKAERKALKKQREQERRDRDHGWRER
jgi:hypothetical protein